MESDVAFRDSRRGVVTPMIALLLVVGAAVTGTFVLGLGSQPEERTPAVDFDASAADGQPDTVTLTHVAGDELRASETRIVVYAGGESARFEPGASSDALTAGDTVVLDISNGDTDADGSAWVDGYPGTATGASLDVAPGEDVTVVVTHAPSDEVISRMVVTVE